MNAIIERLASVAFLAYRLKRKNLVTSIYSHDSGEHYQFSFHPRNSTISVFDYQRGNYLTANKRTNGWMVFDYEEGDYLDLRNRLNGFQIYDYSVGDYIDVKVKPGGVELYNYDDGEYYEFSV